MPGGGLGVGGGGGLRGEVPVFAKRGVPLLPSETPTVDVSRSQRFLEQVQPVVRLDSGQPAFDRRT
jgi:hypothetical protein